MDEIATYEYTCSSGLWPRDAGPLVEWISSSVGCVRSLNSEEHAETGGRNIGTWAALTLSSAGCGHGPDVDEDTITDKS